MKAAVISEGRIAVAERPEPDARDDLVVVRVHGAGINRADLLQRAGNYPAPPGAPKDIPGLEFAGEVAELGPDVLAWREGDRVFGITGGGGHAEYVGAQEGTLARIPDNLSCIDASAVP